MEEDPRKIPEIPAEDHAEFRELFVRSRPDMLLTYHREPHQKLVDRIHRDYMVHGAVALYEVAELRTRSDQISQTSWISKTTEDLLRVVQSDAKSTVSSESQVMDRLHAFFMALEYLNICEFWQAAGPLKYLSELEEWSHEHRGLAALLSADTVIRKRSTSSTMTRGRASQRSARLCWRCSRTTSSSGTTLVRQLSLRSSGKRNMSRQRHPRSEPDQLRQSRLQKEPSARQKNKARREKRKALLKQAKSAAKSSSDKQKDRETKGRRDSRVPEKERSKIMLFTYSGKRGVHSTTACSAAGSAIRTGQSTSACSVGVITPATAISEKSTPHRGSGIWDQAASTVVCDDRKQRLMLEFPSGMLLCLRSSNSRCSPGAFPFLSLIG